MTLATPSRVSRSEWNHLRAVVNDLGFESQHGDRKYYPLTKTFRVTIRNEGGFDDEDIERIKQQGWDIIEVGAEIHRNTLYSTVKIERLKTDVLEQETEAESDDS